MANDKCRFYLPAKGVSDDIDNIAILGSDNLVYVPVTGGSGGIPDAPANSLDHVRNNNAWYALPADTLARQSDSPTDGIHYLRKDGVWVAVPADSLAFQGDVPNDSIDYIRKNSTWIALPTDSLAHIADAPSDGNKYVRQNGLWAEETALQPSVPEAPIDGVEYVRLNAAWSVLPAGLGEAPIDGVEYVRKNGVWAASTGGGGGIGEAPIDGTGYMRQDALWASIPVSIEEAPINTLEYVRKDGTWTTTSMVSFPEAPQDGKQYGRKDGAWDEIKIGSTLPANSIRYSAVVPSQVNAQDGELNFYEEYPTPNTGYNLAYLDYDGLDHSAEIGDLDVGYTIKIYKENDPTSYITESISSIFNPGSTTRNIFTTPIAQFGDLIVTGDIVVFSYSAGSVPGDDLTTRIALITTYENGSGTHVFNADTKWAKVIVTGGGQGGRANVGISGGGSSGGTAIKSFAVQTGVDSSYTVGKGGAGVTGGSAGLNGETSTFIHSQVAVTGGGGIAGNIGDAFGGDINIKGGEGSFNSTPFETGRGTIMSGGGSSYWGGGTHPNDFTKGAYGAGGNGLSTPASLGGNTVVSGEDGVIYIEEYR